jgi:hypothetical protein
MALQRMERVGIVIDDLAAAKEFFVEPGLVLQGEGPVEGRWVDRVVGLEGGRADIAIMQTPDGNGRLELTKFHSPSNQGDNRLHGQSLVDLIELLRHVAHVVFRIPEHNRPTFIARRLHRLVIQRPNRRPMAAIQSARWSTGTHVRIVLAARNEHSLGRSSRPAEKVAASTAL